MKHAEALPVVFRYLLRTYQGTNVIDVTDIMMSII